MPTWQNDIMIIYINPVAICSVKLNTVGLRAKRFFLCHVIIYGVEYRDSKTGIVTTTYHRDRHKDYHDMTLATAD